jgi:hypothetical protein
MRKFIILFLIAGYVLVTSCESLYEAAPDGRLTDKDLLDNPALLKACF